MTTTLADGSASANGTASASAARRPGGLSRAWSDTLTIVQRNLINVKRVPQLLVFSTIQPVIFVLLFRYVFGGAIGAAAGVKYVDYLMPGVFAQTVAFGAINTGIGLADDMSKGLIERFRSLPMARSAVLVGRCVADLARNVFVQILMVAIGMLVGFRFHLGFVRLVAGVLLLLLFGFALSWIFAAVGLATKDAETTQAAAFPVMAPLVFASSAFVPVGSMPGWLQAWARNQPVSVTIGAIRKLILPSNLPLASLQKLGIEGSTWSWVLKSLLWSAAIIAIFAPLAIRQYRKST